MEITSSFQRCLVQKFSKANFFSVESEETFFLVWAKGLFVKSRMETGLTNAVNGQSRPSNWDQSKSCQNFGANFSKLSCLNLHFKTHKGSSWHIGVFSFWLFFGSIVAAELMFYLEKETSFPDSKMLVQFRHTSNFFCKPVHRVKPWVRKFYFPWFCWNAFPSCFR